MLKRLLFFMLVMGSVSISFGQSSETVYKNWQVFPETRNSIEIFYRVVKCNNTNQVQISVFNDGPADQNAQFAITITNKGDGQNLSKDFNFASKKGVFNKPDCDSDALNDLKINLPTGFDPSGLSVKKTYKN